MLETRVPDTDADRMPEYKKASESEGEGREMAEGERGWSGRGRERPVNLLICEIQGSPDL